MTEFECPVCGESFESKRSVASHRTVHENIWEDKQLLERLYHDEKMSQAEIADELNCSPATVTRWMDNFDIEARTAHNTPATFTTEKRGYERWQATVDGKPSPVHVHRLVAVAKYGFDEVCQKEVHHKNNIPWDNRPENLELLSMWDHLDEHFGFSTFTDRLFWNELYHRRGWDTPTIAEHVDFSQATIADHLTNLDQWREVHNEV